MEAPFVGVGTKTLVPAPRPRALHRPQLVRLLDQGLTARLTLVCAPTGWGKTSVLAEWAAAREDARFAWVSLDPADNEPLQFWRYVDRGDCERGAGSGPTPRCGCCVAPWSQSRMRSCRCWSTRWPVLQRPLVLVLDDFHVIALKTIHEQLAYLIERLPHHAHLAIATHSDHDLRVGRLRAMGDLVEVRDEQLRFSDRGGRGAA